MSLGGSRYFVSFINDYVQHTWIYLIDDYSRHTRIYLIEKKSKVFYSFLNLKKLVERETGRKIKCLWSDGGKVLFQSIQR